MNKTDLKKKKDAPHLPSRLVTDIQKQQWVRLYWFIFIVVVSFFVGGVGSIVITSWVIPQQVVPHTTIYNVGVHSGVNSDAPLDPLVLQQTQQRLLRVYDKTKQVENWYRENAYLGQAVILSAGGWATVYRVTDTPLSFTQWEFVDFEGKRYSAETAIQDVTVPGLWYVKLIGDDFRGDITFPNWKELGEDTIFANVGRKDITPLARGEVTTRIPSDTQYRMWSVTNEYRVLGDAAIGDVVVTPSGAFVGFIGRDTTLVGAWHIQGQLVSLFAKGVPTYMDLPLRGFMVDRASGEHDGFYVAQVLNRTTTVIEQGDVIIKIQDEFIDTIDVGQVLSLLPSDVPVTVIRNGEQLSLLLTKEVTIYP